MSAKLSFRERLERRDDTAGERQAPSGSPVRVVLRLAGAVDHPVTLIRTLADWGLGLKKAHAVVTRLADGDTVPVLLSSAPEPAELIAALGRLGVATSVPQPPSRVDVKAIRSRLGLTQAEFATRFCFDLDSVQNWEQGRYAPDRSSRILLAVIDRHPDAVEDVLG